jgi:hypothetical protein
MNIPLKIKIIERYGTQSAFVKDLRSLAGPEISEDRLSKIICGRLKPSSMERDVIAQRLKANPKEIFLDP